MINKETAFYFQLLGILLVINDVSIFIKIYMDGKLIQWVMDDECV